MFITNKQIATLKTASASSDEFAAAFRAYRAFINFADRNPTALTKDDVEKEAAIIGVLCRRFGDDIENDFGLFPKTPDEPADNWEAEVQLINDMADDADEDGDYDDPKTSYDI